MLEADQDRQRWLAGLAALGCLGVAGFAAARISTELTRSPTSAEWSQATALELAGRWHARPSGTIFPERLGYSPELGGEEEASRVGIVAGTDCGGALDAVLQNLLVPYGCRGVLRAAYLDQPQGLLINVGLVAFADPDTAGRAQKALDGTKGSLRAVVFPGSVAARFTDAARQTTVFGRRGPYLTVTTTGYSDGRPARGQKKQADLSVIAPQLAEQVLDRLTAPVKAVCGVPEYKC
ncbi:MAG: hypothetical protein ABIS86_07060 [Streptosporangiaceae bacterium]